MSRDEAKFEVAVTVDDCQRFAELSGDWNPLHTDAVHASASVYGRQVLHGAFSAGLISKLAGMYLPGRDCLLYGLKLRFIVPILPPSNLIVSGRVISMSDEVGRVDATIIDKTSGIVYVAASYDFGLHRMALSPTAVPVKRPKATDEPVVLVTGSSGGLGSALMRRLGARGLAVRRNLTSGEFEIEELMGILGGRPIAAIVHCAWPAPDNTRFIDLDNPKLSIQEHVASPLRNIQSLAALIASQGNDNASLILIGSTFAKLGRHYFRMPLYSIAKSIIPTLVEVLAIELASKKKRCLGVVFDVIDGGMNKGISAAARQASADRSPWGELANTDEAAEQIIWLLKNQGKLISGAILTLSAGAIP
jgi:acyl dehydratase/NAD(P)-dependent dehydrogenase (short-subunit alcohol dehydrogenase family)